MTELPDDKTTIYKSISLKRNRGQLNPDLSGYFAQSLTCSLPQPRKRQQYLQGQSVQRLAESGEDGQSGESLVLLF